MRAQVRLCVCSGFDVDHEIFVCETRLHSRKKIGLNYLDAGTMIIHSEKKRSSIHGGCCELVRTVHRKQKAAPSYILLRAQDFSSSLDIQTNVYPIGTHKNQLGFIVLFNERGGEEKEEY